MKSILRNIACGLILLSFVLANGQIFSAFCELGEGSKTVMTRVVETGSKGASEWSFKPSGDSSGNLYRESEGRVNLPTASVINILKILSKYQFVSNSQSVTGNSFNEVASTGVVKENLSQKGFYLDLLCLLRI